VQISDNSGISDNRGIFNNSQIWDNDRIEDKVFRFFTVEKDDFYFVLYCSFNEVLMNSMIVIIPPISSSEVIPIKFVFCWFGICCKQLETLFQTVLFLGLSFVIKIILHFSIYTILEYNLAFINQLFTIEKHNFCFIFFITETCWFVRLSGDFFDVHCNPSSGWLNRQADITKECEENNDIKLSLEDDTPSSSTSKPYRPMVQSDTADALHLAPLSSDNKDKAESSTNNGISKEA